MACAGAPTRRASSGCGRTPASPSWAASRRPASWRLYAEISSPNRMKNLLKTPSGHSMRPRAILTTRARGCGTTASSIRPIRGAFSASPSPRRSMRRSKKPGSAFSGCSVSEHRVTVQWNRSGEFRYETYSRNHVIAFGDIRVPGNAAAENIPATVAPAIGVDPEQSFLASLSACHMLWFLHLACQKKWVVDRYVDEAVGVLDKTWIPQVTLRPLVFCAGADLNWMKRMAGYGYEENLADARALADMLAALDRLPKPTIARVHGPAFAGGTGLVAACDIAIGTPQAKFCFSEAKLGLSPATISPYVMRAIGERAARRYFLTAEVFDAAEACRIGLLSACVSSNALDSSVEEIIKHLLAGGSEAHAKIKELIRAVAGRAVDAALVADTARRIAEIRVSPEGREGIASFLEKRKPSWGRGKD